MMAHIKTANARIVNPKFALQSWQSHTKKAKIKTASVLDTSSLIEKFNPRDWLLSHCTIVTSCDVASSPLNPESGFDDYYITPETEMMMNNNKDAWEKKLLLKTFHTFVGAENYEEHVQIPSLSKGKIIDAVPRLVKLDSGASSVYVDILVATSKRNAMLCADILSNRISELSMGCRVDFTICSKCGHRAKEKEDLCTHILFQKGEHFYDKNGVRRIIGELCGHYTDPSSVKFIEASWVRNAAFKGAVMRNIVYADDTLMQKVAAEVTKPRPVSSMYSGNVKIAKDLSQRARLTWGVKTAARKKKQVQQVVEDPNQDPAQPAPPVQEPASQQPSPQQPSPQQPAPQQPAPPPDPNVQQPVPNQPQDQPPVDQPVQQITPQVQVGQGPGDPNAVQGDPNQLVDPNQQMDPNTMDPNMMDPNAQQQADPTQQVATQPDPTALLQAKHDKVRRMIKSIKSDLTKIRKTKTSPIMNNFNMIQANELPERTAAFSKKLRGIANRLVLSLEDLEE